jgi:DNA-binding NarL/FixJ family response regulator
MSTISPIKILLVDDDPWVRPSLRIMVESVPRFKLVAEAKSTEEALQCLQDNPEIDLALVDIHMRGANGIRLTEQIHTEYPHIAVLILSNEDGEEYVRKAGQAGARGYLLKETPWAEIVSTIENIIDNPPELAPERLLTVREQQVLWHIGAGKLTKLIARELKKKSEPQKEISTRTAEGHRSNIRRKLGIKSQCQLIIIATEYRKRHDNPPVMTDCKTPNSLAVNNNHHD